ncbi:hypothetical protein ACFV42_49695, partial [Streptomyces solisilvae]|uniref:hypothetical protein n=2 Tax=Streptomyces TaxID=1883 RepID=UPI00369CCC3B
MKRWIAALALLGVGCGIGSCVAQDQPAQDPPIIKTKYVDRPVEKKVTVKAYSVPSSCLDALVKAERLNKDMDKMIGVASTAGDILTAGHEAITMHNGTEINTQRDK